MVKPARVQDFFFRKKPKAQYESEMAKCAQIFDQEDAFRKKLDHEVPGIKFFFKFTCDDPSCEGHEISVLDWEFFQLYRRTKANPDWFQKMRQKVLAYCADRETFFFMGNLAHPAKRNVFCISGLF